MKNGVSDWGRFTNGRDWRNLKRLRPGLNALAEVLLIARLSRDSLPVAVALSRLVASGITRDDCRQLRARGLIDFDGNVAPSSRIVLTDSGLALLQSAIPAGALRPVYEIDSRKLTIAGHDILRLASQARNLSAMLTAIENAGWPPRVTNPLSTRRCGGDSHHLAVAAHKLTVRQGLIDFHLDDGAIAWNWRPARGIDRQHAGGALHER